MGDSYVVTGAVMTCTFGMAPSSLVVLPARTKYLCGVPRANIMDYTPMVNILPFGMCNTLSNPTVASATAAAQGVLTPMPCVPAIIAPWMPGNPQCLVQGQPALTKSSMCTCMWGGAIRFTTDGQMPSPPPVIIPPVSINMSMPKGAQPLSQEELDEMPAEEQEAYANEMKKASKEGAGDMAIADNLDEMAERYRQQGAPDKALKAEQASQDYRLRATEKQASAMEKVNNKYRAKNDITTKAQDMSKEELQSVYEKARQDQAQQQQQLDALDEKIAANSKEWNKRSENLNEANKQLAETSGPYQEARQERMDATAKREQCEQEVAYWRRNEQIAKDANNPTAAALHRQQRKLAEAKAGAAVQEETTAKAKEEKAKKIFDNASDKQKAAADAYHQSLENYRELSDQKKNIEAEKKKTDHTASASLTALNALDEKEKHKAAVARHQTAKEDTRDKRLTMDGFSQEQKKAEAEADAWFKSGLNAQSNGNQELTNKFYHNTSEFDQQAKDAAQKKQEAKQEYENSREELKKAYQDAYSDDALLESYTADLNYDKAMKELSDDYDF